MLDEARSADAPSNRDRLAGVDSVRIAAGRERGAVRGHTQGMLVIDRQTHEGSDSAGANHGPAFPPTLSLPRRISARSSSFVPSYDAREDLRCCGNIELDEDFWNSRDDLQLGGT